MIQGSSLGSSVSIVTELRVRRSTSIPGRGNDEIYLCHLVHTDCGLHL